MIPKENDLLALHHIWNDPGYKAALQEVGFEDYHYQDQTDPPPDMSDEEWSRRCDDWYKYYFDAEAEAQASPAFNYTVIDWQDIRGCPVDTNNILATTPDEKIRRWRVARFLAQLEAARPQRIRGHYDMWRETERRVPEVRLCEDKDTIRSAMLEGLCSELRWRSGR